MSLIDFIKKTAEGHDLTKDEAERAFQIIMNGGATPAQIAAFLISLKMKGETVDEILGSANVMRFKADKFKAPQNALDTCGTGGDSSGTYNISTAVAFVVAGSGVPVAKHGNKAISSKSGSADVLRELGVNIDAEKRYMEQALEQANICFMMASKYHGAMRHVAPTRQELGVRTIFNILGPLSNPAGASYQLLGVYSRELVVKIAMVLQGLGSKRAWVVHGEDGLDEITTTGITHVAEVNEAGVATFTINPADYGIQIADPADLQGGDAAYNARALRDLLLGRGKGAYLDIVLLNSAASLVVCGKAVDLHAGLVLARESIDSLRANDALLKLVEISNLGLGQE